MPADRVSYAIELPAEFARRLEELANVRGWHPERMGALLLSWAVKLLEPDADDPEKAVGMVSLAEMEFNLGGRLAHEPSGGASDLDDGIPF